MDRVQKEALVAGLKESFSSAGLIVVTRQVGMTVSEARQLRVKMFEAGATYKVAKNRLVKLAIKDTDFDGLSDLFTGPTAVSFSEDPVAAARVAAEFAKENKKIEILGGALGSKILDQSGVDALAKLPSLDELRGKLAGLMVAPAAKIARVTQAPAGQIARVIKAHSDKQAAA
jgi:large subunit ribosomal protein L10